MLVNSERDNSLAAKSLERIDELRNLEKNYRHLHSVKDDLFELCSLLSDREPELGDQMLQFCYCVHERCEAIYPQIIDLKKDLGYPLLASPWR